MAAPEPTVITIGNEEVPLLDPVAVLSDHRRTSKVKTSMGAIVLHSVSLQAMNLLRHQYRAWLNGGGLAGLRETALLMQRGWENLTEEERQKLEDYTAESWNYNTELTHLMLSQPVIELDVWRKVIRELPQEDWLAIQKACTDLLKDPAPDELKN
jgi:hypothetical protein